MAQKKVAPAIKQPQVLSIALEVTGTASLIQNCFDQKAIEQMLRKHMGLSVEKEAKIPADCIKRAIIRNEAGRGAERRRVPQGVRGSQSGGAAVVVQIRSGRAGIADLARRDRSTAAVTKQRSQRRQRFERM